MSRQAFAGALALLAATLLINLIYVYRCGDGLSPFADPYSEANALRAGELFAEQGFTVNYGLPDVTYGARYPGKGIKKSSGKEADDPVYHGYPPGSDWLAGVYIKVFGIDHVARFRSAPIAFGMAASIVFLIAMTRTLGAPRALFIYLACLLAPMFTYMTHGLYYHGYAQSLLLLEIAALLLALSKTGPAGVRFPALVFLICFLQGWLSFDYCFVVTFAAAPLAFLISPADAPLDWRKVLILVIVAGLGFTAAHVLHFLQSAVYFGGIREAVEEYAYRSNKRYGLTGSPLEQLSKPALIVQGLRLYWVAFLRYTTLFSPASIVLLVMTAAMLSLRRGTAMLKNGLAFEVDSATRGRDLIGLALAALVSTAWLFAKPFHAMNHLYFNGRHFFLFYFACCLVIARAAEMTIIRGAEEKSFGEESEHRAKATPDVEAQALAASS